MVYDAHAKRVAIKAIGTVESNLNYSAVNYADPITVGIMQWFGVRAANILFRIKTETPSVWTGIPSSVEASMSAHPATDSWWNARYLTRAEGAALKPVLANSVAIQDNQASSDLDAYVSVATRNGMDKDNNTQAMLFFFTMYHQSPVQALRVLSSAGPSSSIQRLYAVCLNNSVLGRYRTRYTTARDIILANDDSGVGTSTPPTPDAPGGDDGTGTSRAVGNIKLIERNGDQLIITQRDGTRIFAVPTGNERWIVKADENVGAPVPDPPDEPTGGDDDAKRAALLAWMVARSDSFAYAQAPGRLDPDASGLTDCSGLVHRAYKDVTGLFVGTWTGDQHDRGRLVATGSGVPDVSSWKVGDLVFIDWSGGGIDHVEMYAGDGKVWGHGGPDNGPDLQNVNYMFANVHYWKVKRHLS